MRNVMTEMERLQEELIGKIVDLHTDDVDEQVVAALRGIVQDITEDSTALGLRLDRSVNDLMQECVTYFMVQSFFEEVDMTDPDTSGDLTHLQKAARHFVAHQLQKDAE